MIEFEQMIFGIISSAGDSRAKAFEAMKEIKKGNYDEARIMLEASREADTEAHNIQTKLIQQEISGEIKPELTLLMVHAQDHYMTSQLTRDMVEELINIFEAKEKGE